MAKTLYESCKKRKIKSRMTLTVYLMEVRLKFCSTKEEATHFEQTKQSQKLMQNRKHAFNSRNPKVELNIN